MPALSAVATASRRAFACTSRMSFMLILVAFAAAAVEVVEVAVVEELLRAVDERLPPPVPEQDGVCLAIRREEASQTNKCATRPHNLFCNGLRTSSQP